MTTTSSEANAGAIVLVAALPRELARLARQVGVRSISNKAGVLLQEGKTGARGRSVLLVTAGIGPERAVLAVAAAVAHGPVGALLSVGLAGACDPGLVPGSVIAASTVIDTRSGERFGTYPLFDPGPDPAPRMGASGGGRVPLAGLVTGILVTSPQIAGVAEKRRLYQSYGAAAVDMEAATVARLARGQSIPFGALKAISDEHDVDLSHLSSFTDSQGRFRTGAFALETAVRPQHWRSTIQLGRNTKTALDHLTGAMHRAISKVLAEEAP